MEVAAIRIIGIDPGLRNMGWGIVELAGSRLIYVASGTIRSNDKAPLAGRLRALHEGLAEIVAGYRPDEAAIEEVFVNKDPQSTLKLGQARGIALVVPALAGLPVVEYAANLVKKTVVGAGHAEKAQIALMVKVLLPKWQSAVPEKLGADAADALAVAITHARYRGTHAYVSEKLSSRGP
jgi:crossover junction endodeoxyribonuclease RuvC